MKVELSAIDFSLDTSRPIQAHNQTTKEQIYDSTQVDSDEYIEIDTIEAVDKYFNYTRDYNEALGDVVMLQSVADKDNLPANVAIHEFANGIYTIMLPQNCKGLFKDCKHLRNITIEGTDCYDVYTTESMFENCRLLESVNLREAKGLCGVENTSKMFKGCSSLRVVEFPEEQNEKDLIKDYSGMYEGCEILEYKDTHWMNITYK